MLLYFCFLTRSTSAAIRTTTHQNSDSIIPACRRRTVLACMHSTPLTSHTQHIHLRFRDFWSLVLWLVVDEQVGRPSMTLGIFKLQTALSLSVSPSYLVPSHLALAPIYLGPPNSIYTSQRYIRICIPYGRWGESSQVEQVHLDAFFNLLQATGNTKL